MIDVQDLTKRFGDKVAVDGLTFTVRPGRVTGFLGPNGAGKSTTMRMVLGLEAPTGGRATVNGRLYDALRARLRAVGSLLDAKAVHGGRTARQHLLVLARSNGIGARRVDHVNGLVGLDRVADKRVKGFSLGMAQRLGIAAAMLGDPGVLILDEPVNGLDTEGTAGSVTCRLIADAAMRAFIAHNSQEVTVVRSPQPAELRALLERRGADVTKAVPTGCTCTTAPRRPCTPTRPDWCVRPGTP
ncbi:ABC transporter ATP-binding protein [soil metagenome]